MKSMANMVSYFNSLLPSLKKKDIIVDLSYSFNETETIVQPMFSLDPMPKLMGLTFEKTHLEFKRSVNAYKGNGYATIAEICGVILENQEKIFQLAKHDFGDENLKIVTDYYKLNLIKYFEAINYFKFFLLITFEIKTFYFTFTL